VNTADKQAFIDASASIYEQFGAEVDGGAEMIETVLGLGEGS
jgi:hypothetical protein